MESLILLERVRNTIQLGESHFREFKSAVEGPEGAKKPRPPKRICVDIGEALVAFANADGGELLIGVEDDGTVTGVPHSELDVDQMLAAPQSHVHQENPLHLLAATKLVLGDKLVLFFSVPKATTEVYQLPDGRCICRKDKSTAPETVKHILFSRQEAHSRQYDQQFVDGATVADLDIDYIQDIADTYLRGLTAERYLQQIGLAEFGQNGLRLRMAAILLFAREVQRWHPRCQVRILKVDGIELKSGEKYNVTSDESVQGNVFQLLLHSWEKLRPFLAYKTEFGADARFEQKYLYPEQACREALVNAIAHRDYAIHNGIDVFIFDDRMEIRNPGALLSTIRIEDLTSLQGTHESRNAIVARVLRENKVMRELGEGMRRMFELMEENELEKPTLHSDYTSFSITLPHKSVFSTKQEQWLLMFQQFKLTNPQKKIVVLGMEDRLISPSDIYKAMNTDDRDREVTTLRLVGILEEVLSNPSATALARKRKMSKTQIPRFKVHIPTILAGGALSPQPEIVSGVIAETPVRTQGPRYQVFVANVAPEWSPAEVRAIFSHYGDVQTFHWPTDVLSGRRREFLFISYWNPPDAARAIQSLNGHQFLGRILTVKTYAERVRPSPLSSRSLRTRRRPGGSSTQ